jgi:glutamyl-tRNA synthetase
MSIRTRFAPSPTGYLHIGGVRTALFNWLLTRRLGGQFVLRIDDTDAERNRPEALTPILEGFKWLGILWDEGPEVGGPHAPYFQSGRLENYKAAALSLLEKGFAYPDYMSKEELEADRKLAESQKRAYVHRGPLRDAPAAENLKRFQDNPAPIRLRVPENKTLVVDDLICGRCEQDSNLVGDPVILRADGRALYNFASVVDDIALGITHIVRAREHLSNTYGQTVVFDALGATMPRFAHVPVVNEPKSKKKLSKRDMAKFVTPEVRAKLHAIGYTDEQIASRDDLNPATVAYYRELGYLPEALVNYLARLGWSLDDKTEFIPIPEMIAHFSLERVNDSPASFDPDKLFWLAGEYMKILPLDQKINGCLPFLARAGLISESPDEETLARVQTVVEAAGERIKLFSDIISLAGPFLRGTIEIQPQAVEKFLKPTGTADILTGFRSRVGLATPFDAATLDKTLHQYCVEMEIKPGKIVQPVRVALTGSSVGFGLFDTFAILGREESLSRLDKAISISG